MGIMLRVPEHPCSMSLFLQPEPPLYLWVKDFSPCALVHCGQEEGNLCKGNKWVGFGTRENVRSSGSHVQPALLASASLLLPSCKEGPRVWEESQAAPVPHSSLCGPQHCTGPQDTMMEQLWAG